ncbi:LON peptidase substrate-binding domain-containing protein [Croceivirga radicis]|uniref:LON peptidase substrate-binding domain-containing protein n=1 Tax=Croceivirga radicis TaxID=1929488 RepID=UPI000255AF89|nr:LON peptidase substrate-binding domain-containing protein [Croceivirga radicis]
MKLPLFPLRSIFYPGETVPLHIFEDRYKQLINDCREEALTFGIPVFFNNTMTFGTEIQLVEVVNTYAGGEMDVVGVGRQIFKIDTFADKFNGRLYPGGEVTFLDMENDADLHARRVVYRKIQELYDLMEIEFPEKPLDKFNSYAFAHKMGLSFEQEFNLLQIAKESDRLHFLNRHLDETIAVLHKLKRTRGAIEMNGHFRNFDPLDFGDFKI